MHLHKWTPFMVVLAALTFFATTAYAQAQDASAPPSIDLRASRPNVVELPALDVPAKEFASKTKIGLDRALDEAIMEKGRWQGLPDGRSLWSLGLKSPLAVGLRVHFENFSIGSGQVWVRTGVAADAKFFGPFTGTGPAHDGEVWTGLLFSDSVEIEYVPADVSVRTKPSFRVAAISHFWRFSPSNVHPAASLGTSCFLNAACAPNYQSAASATVLVLINTNGSTRTCSGVLIDSASRKPYILTAGHCINSTTSVQGILTVFNWQASTCLGPDPSRDTFPQMPGGTLRSSSAMVGGLDYAPNRVARLSIRVNSSVRALQIIRANAKRAFCFDESSGRPANVICLRNSVYLRRHRGRLRRNVLALWTPGFKEVLIPTPLDVRHLQSPCDHW